jgi:hypothetical protein
MMHLLLASPWYTSGPFVVGSTIGGLSLSVAGIWISIYAAGPKRQLVYQVDSVSVDYRITKDDRIEVEFAGNAMGLATFPNFVKTVLKDLQDGNPKDVRLIRIRIANRGRHDIPSDAFDKNRPLRIDIGLPILDIVEEESSPNRVAHPRVGAEGTTVTMAPELIKKRQIITVVMVAEGGRPIITIDSPLVDTNVRQYSDASTGPQVWAFIAATSLTTTFAAFGVLRVVKMVTHSQVMAATAAVMISICIVVSSVWLLGRRRELR